MNVRLTALIAALILGGSLAVAQEKLYGQSLSLPGEHRSV